MNHIKQSYFFYKRVAALLKFFKRCVCNDYIHIITNIYMPGQINENKYRPLLTDINKKRNIPEKGTI